MNKQIHVSRGQVFKEQLFNFLIICLLLLSSPPATTLPFVLCSLFQLLQCLDEDEFARRYRLAFRLNQVHMAMDSYV